MLCAVFFHSLFGSLVFFFWFRLFMIADGKLFFLCPSLWMLMFKGVGDVLASLTPAQTSSRPDTIVLPLGKQEIVQMFSA